MSEYQYAILSFILIMINIRLREKCDNVAIAENTMCTNFTFHNMRYEINLHLNVYFESVLQ